HPRNTMSGFSLRRYIYPAIRARQGRRVAEDAVRRRPIHHDGTLTCVSHERGGAGGRSDASCTVPGLGLPPASISSEMVFLVSAGLPESLLATRPRSERANTCAGRSSTRSPLRRHC